MLQQKRLAAFPPTAKETNAVSPISKLYDDRLRVAFYDMGNSEGKKILVVTDRMSKDDTDHNEILSGDEATTFENVVNYAYKECENPEDVREVAVFNWEFSFLKTAANKTATDKKNIQTVNDAYYLRFKRFIKKYRPDVIVLAGIEMYEYIITRITGVSDHSNPWKITMGRIRSYKIDDIKYRIIGTLDYYRMCTWDGRYIKEFPNLLGFFARALIAAFNNKNRYTAKIRTSDIDFKLIDSIKKFDIFYKRLIKQPIVGIDTEGAGLAKIKNSLYSYQFAWSTDHAYFLPLDIPDTPFSPKELVYIKKKLKYYFEFGKSKYHIYQNAKFDVTMALVQLGVRYYAHRVYDVQYGEYALDENRKLLKKYGFAKPHGPYSLSLICESYGIDIYRKIDFSKGDRGNIGAEGLTKRLIEYGCLDSIVLLWISKFQIAEAKRIGHKKFMTFVCEQMSDSSLAFTSLELRGALIDKRHLWHLRSADGPIETVIKDSKNAFRKSEAAQRVNTYLCRKKGVPVGASIFGGNVWLFDPDKQEHQQLLFFKALKLEPLAETKAGGGKVDKFFQEKYKDSCSEVKTFNEYKKNLTIRNTFINGISNKLATNPDCKLDGALRSYYDSTDVVTSRTSCLDGSTPVYVLDSRGLVPIKDIVAGDWVWAFDKNLNPIAAKVSWSGKTKKSETITVTYQGDRGTIKTIVCTPDHKFRLRDGRYIEAQELKTGDRVLSVERRYSKLGYRQLVYTGMPNKKIWEHKVVSKCSDDLVAHHIDEVKDNNVPSNLKNMTQTEHMEYHTWTDEKRNKLKALGIDYKSLRKRFNGERQFITDAMLKKAAKFNNLNEAATFLKVSYYKAKDLLQEFDNNHVIIKVTPNVGSRWVYDITVPKYHNFIANGVCVHNSKDPNLQNIPSRGPLAKPVKRLFITRPGCLICKNDYSAHEVREWANEAGDKKLASSFYEGMRYRQDMRRHAYEEPETAFEWSKIKAEKGWYDIKGADAADRKNTIIKKLKHKGVKYLAQVEYDIEVKGDVHRLNCVRFFKITVFEVTDDQRQDIKKVVFGVIYGKGAASLAIELKKDEEYAENLIEGLFREFDKGGSWIKRIEAFGQEHFFIETPIGMRRHLWGYMHTRKAVVNAMNRRGPNCVDLKTECLTENGWKTVDKLKIGEKIYTKNPNTGELELQPLKAIARHKYKGKMWECNSGINALTTPNHRWLVDWGKVRGANTKFATSEELAASGSNNPIHLVADRPFRQKGDKWTDKEVSLIGWILTDATYDVSGPKRSSRIRIVQSSKGNPEKVKIIDKLIKKLAPNASRHGPDAYGAIRWVLQSSLPITQKIITTLPDRTLTSEFLGELTTKQLRLLYDNMLLGDGSFNYKQNRYVDFTAGTKKRAEMFSMLCVMLGIPCNIYSRKPTIAVKQYASMPNIPKQAKRVWLVFIKTRDRCQAVTNRGKWKNYDGEVWCPSVKNSTWIAKRNGSIYVTGNTILQGTASNIGVMSMRQMQHLAWNFFVKHDVPFYYQSSTNYVHDSVEAENRIHSVPIYLYLIEHASTTLIHKRLREVFDYKLTIGLEMEFQLGGSLDRCKKWDFMPDTLMTMMEKEIKFCKEELGYDNIDYTWEMNTAYRNWKIIQKIRRDELAQSLKSKAPSEIMLMNEQNARSLGLIIRE